MKTLSQINFAVLVFSLFVAVVQGICSEEFTVTSQNAQADEPEPIDETFTEISTDVMETLPEGSALYTISWKSDTSKDPQLDKQSENGAADYVSYNLLSEKKKMEFFVSQSMSGLVDYNAEDRKTTLKMNINFYFTSSNIVESCKLEITHVLIDENTQEPHFKQSSYDADVREDFPLQLPIPGLKLFAYDDDADSPNNEFDVDVNEGCPLQSVQSSYVCELGLPVSVQFVLVQPLDYDVMKEPFTYVCIVTLINDLGKSSLSSSSNITVNVEACRDEEPVFSSNYYKGYLEESTEGSVVDIDPTIKAHDLDQPSSIIIYSMESVDEGIDGDRYFEIEPNSGIVTVSQDIDRDFLSYQQIEFFLSACDEDDQCSTALLVIVLNAATCDLEDPQFEKVTYTAQLLSPGKGENVLRVHAQTSADGKDLTYYFADESRYFDIGEKNGIITTAKEETPPRHYVLIAMVTDGKITDQTTVNIEILVGEEGILVMEESVIMTNITEDYTGPLVTVHARGATFYCIEGILPSNSSDSFRLDNATGEVEVVDSLNVEPDMTTLDPFFANKNLVKIAAYKSERKCKPSDISTHLKSHEALIAILVTDINEYSPYFVDITGANESLSSILYAYPENQELRKTTGPVATVLVDDPDRTSSLTFSILDSDDFVIDETSGEIYLLGGEGCEKSECHFKVVVDDKIHESDLLVTVTKLDFNHIFTLNLTSIGINDVERTLGEMSRASGMSIYLLYANVLGIRTRSTTSPSKWDVEAQVYATYDSELVDLDEFNEHLDSSGDMKMEGSSFSDRSYYAVDESAPVATIVLGCILGLLLLILALIGCYLCCCQSTQKQELSPHVQTLGLAYGNAGFKEDAQNLREPSFSAIFGDVGGASSRSTSVDCQTSLTTSQITTSLNTFPNKRQSFSLYPNPQLTSIYEADINRAAVSISESLGSNLNRNQHTSESSDAVSNTCSTNGKSNLKVSSTEVHLEEEPKSVAFKVLVDTQEIEAVDQNLESKL